MWNLINNELKIFIDPFLFAGWKNIQQKVALINTLQDYLSKTDPNLCSVNFFYPKYLEQNLNLRRAFFPTDKLIYIDKPPNGISDFSLTTECDFKTKALYNELLTLSVQNKCAYFLTDFNFNKEDQQKLLKEKNLAISNIKDIFQIIEQFLQGFYNYFKFRLPVYGIDSSDIAHAISDEFFTTVLVRWEEKINRSSPSEETKERVRSFIHNRYIDILITIDQINFFKLQQRIFDIENNIIENKEPHFQGYIRYYINYYLFLLWGSIDHLSWIMNDIFSFGFNPENGKDRRKVGLHSKKVDFLKKIELVDSESASFIKSQKFQDWLYFLSKLRHKSAHREMFSASQLLLETPELRISDTEIDQILYKDRPIIPEEVQKLLPKEFVENQKIIDRLNYRISKMKKGIDHFALIEKDGQQFMFDPVSRINIDLDILRELIQKIVSAYNSQSKK